MSAIVLALFLAFSLAVNVSLIFKQRKKKSTPSNEAWALIRDLHAYGVGWVEFRRVDPNDFLMRSNKR
jgi:hypothetical protein